MKTEQMREKDLRIRIADAVDAARNANPLIGSVTNAVSVNLVANAQLAVGGSAAVVYLEEEGESLIRSGGAFYINMGTLLPIHRRTLPYLAEISHREDRPWVLDPVAAGLGSLRNDLLVRFKEYKPDVIRGNASEIIALASIWGLEGGGPASNVRGVDSTESVLEAKDAAVSLAKWTGGAVSVSGETDLVTDGSAVAISYGGSPFFERITGAGCSLGGVTAVYAAVSEPFIAALTATAIYNLAGSRAGRKADTPGRFQTEFLDELYRTSSADVADNPFDLEVME